MKTVDRRQASVVSLVLIPLMASLAACRVSGSATPAAPVPAATSAQTKPNRLFAAADLGLIEPPDRDQWQPPEIIMDDLGIADGATVADLGAGGGWFTVHLARRVGPRGRVHAIDVQQQMIEQVKRRAQRERLFNIRPVVGSAADPSKIPPGLDVAVAVDVYHEMACAQRPKCEEPITVLTNVAKSLKPQGRLGIIDFLPGEGGPGPSADERVDPDSVIAAASRAGLQMIAQRKIPPFQFQYLLVFGKAPNARQQ